MTKKRDNKTKKRNVPDSSDTISIDGSTAPQSFTARGRTHLGDSPMESFSNRAISPPVTGQLVTSQPVTGLQGTGHPDHPVRTSLKEDINLRRREDRSFSSSSSRSNSSNSHKNKKSKRSKHSHKRRRRSTPSSSSISSTQSENDYGRYKRVKLALQVAETPTPLQPADHVNITPNLPEIPINITPQMTENVLQGTKDSGSDSEAEVWSFDRAINKVFSLLPPVLCPKTTQEKSTSKPLSGIEHLIESHATPLLFLPQS